MKAETKVNNGVYPYWVNIYFNNNGEYCVTGKADYSSRELALSYIHTNLTYLKTIKIWR